jgi:purine-binding chemotaxis protein CheW
LEDGVMSRVHRFVVFTLEEQRYALPLTAVERIIRTVYVTKVPESPEIIFGIVNMGGDVVPVIDLRKRFGLPDHEMSLDDRMILANTPRWKVALWVDSVQGVLELTGTEMVPAGKVFPGIEGVSGVAKMDGDIIQIYDLERCLSLNDESFLREVMNAESERRK